MSLMDRNLKNLGKFAIYIMLCSLSFFANSSESNSYSGIYKTDSGYLTYIQIKNVNDRYFVRSSYGSTEIAINNNGKFKPKDESIDVIGQFEDKINNKFIKQTITSFGVRDIYYRADIPKEQYTSVLYDHDIQMRNFSSSKIGGCTDDIKSVALSSVTDKSQVIDELISEIKRDRSYFPDINSLLILKDNKLLVEHYFNGWSVDEPHQVQSVSKSLTSLLVGSAVTENKITNINKTLSELLPNYKKYLNNGKEDITLQHLLTMSAGIDWNESAIPYSNPENVRTKEWSSSDSVAFTLERPLVNKPGTTFSYSGGFVSVVGEVLRKATNQQAVSDYAKNGPLSELCFKNAYWLKQRDSRTDVAAGAHLRPRDMLKLGQLILNEGNWNGKQLIDKKWLTESTKPVLFTNGIQYGYYWWHQEFVVNDKEYSAILAHGLGGQEIVIVKDLNLVVVKTASDFTTNSPMRRMMTDYIIPVFENTKTL